MHVSLYMHRDFTGIHENVNAVKHSIELCLLYERIATLIVIHIVGLYSSIKDKAGCYASLHCDQHGHLRTLAMQVKHYLGNKEM